MTLLNISLLLFLIMDSFGNISSYLTLTNDLKPNRQYFVIFREMLIALAVMLGLYFLGSHLCSFLTLSQASLKLSAGLILFLHSIKILFPEPTNLRANLPKGEPIVFPLAIPLIVSPGLMASILLFSNIQSSRSVMLPAIIIAWLASVVILYFSRPIYRLIGKNGLTASERLLGMVLVIISVQFFLDGILTFWKQYQIV